MELTVLTACLLLISSAHAQKDGLIRSYHWQGHEPSASPYEHDPEPLKPDYDTLPQAPLYSQPSPYSDPDPTSSFDSEPYKFDLPESSPYKYEAPPTGPYNSYKFMDEPSPFKYPDSKYPESEYPESKYQELSEYPAKKEPVDMSQLRVGGFAGSGDTKGFGAYDLPKEKKQQVDEGEDELEGVSALTSRRRKPLLQYASPLHMIPYLPL